MPALSFFVSFFFRSAVFGRLLVWWTIFRDAASRKSQCLLKALSLLLRAFFFWLCLASLGGHACVLHLLLARPLTRRPATQEPPPPAAT